MTKFDEAAEHASFDVRTEYAPLLGTYGVVISEKSAQKITEIISKHYAEIEAGHKKLVELAVQLSIVYSHDKEIRDKIEALKLLVPMLSDPLVKAEIERSKG